MKNETILDIFNNCSEETKQQMYKQFEEAFKEPSSNIFIQKEGENNC